jgi:hypothetical protein
VVRRKEKLRRIGVEEIGMAEVEEEAEDEAMARRQDDTQRRRLLNSPLSQA